MLDCLLFHVWLHASLLNITRLILEQEVPGSAGTTNVFNLVAGRVDIPFSMRKGSEQALDNGCLSIVRCVFFDVVA